MAYRPLKTLNVSWRVLGLAAGLVALWPSLSNAYQIHIGDQMGTATSITSVLGEARPNSSSSGTPFTPNRFHQGADIAAVNGFNVKPSSQIFSIEAGRVSNFCTGDPSVPNNCGINAYVKVQSLSDPNHTFAYVHVDPAPSLSIGDVVTTTMTIGTALLTHLHLNDIETINGVPYDLNPLRPGALDFTDYNPPQFQTPGTIYPGTTIAGITPLIPVPDCLPANCKNGPGSNPNPTTFDQTYNPADNSYTVPPEPVDLLLTGADGNPNVAGLQRRGLYSIYLYVTPISDSFNILSSRYMAFDSILENNPYSGVLDLYLQRNQTSDTYFATSVKDNEPSSLEASDGFIDFSNTSVFPAGEYQICAGIDGVPSAPFAFSAENCVNVIIDRGPKMTIKGYNQPVYAPPNPAIWTRYFADFSLSAPDYLASFNVYNNASESQNLFSESFEPGVSIASDVFVGVFSATEAASNIPDGIGHLAVLSDQLGQETSGYFSYDATQPTVSVSNVQTSPPLGSLPPWFVSSGCSSDGTCIQGVGSECPTFTVTGNASDNLAGMTEI